MGDDVDFAAEFEGALRELRERGVGYEVERQPIQPFQVTNFEETIGVRVPADLRRCMLELGCVYMGYERENEREGSFAIHDLVYVAESTQTLRSRVPTAVPWIGRGSRYSEVVDSVTGEVWEVDEFGGPYADDAPLEWDRVVYDARGHQVGVPHIVVAPSFSALFMAERRRLFEDVD